MSSVLTLKYTIFYINQKNQPDKMGSWVYQCVSPDAVQSIFLYDKEYIEQEKYPDLCPVYLPKRAEPYIIDNLKKIPWAFEDSLPDGWGKRILIDTLHLPKDHTGSHYLLGYLSEPLGALRFQVDYANPPFIVPTDPVDQTTLIQKIKNIKSIEHGHPLIYHDDIKNYSGSSGGARPKLVTRLNNKNTLLKVSSDYDRFPVILAEYLCMLTAHSLDLCGRPVYHRIPNEDKYDEVLEMDRFDITPQGGRRHRLSMYSLLGAPSESSSYYDLACVIKKLSRHPDHDLKRLFLQALLNIIIGNVDDHLRNFSMLYDEEDGWHLSPAYDLTAADQELLDHQTGSPSHHYLCLIQQQTLPKYTAAFIIDLGQSIGLSSQESIQQSHVVLHTIHDCLLTHEWMNDEKFAGWRKDLAYRCQQLDESLKNAPMPN